MNTLIGYVIVFQLLCGVFSAFVAQKKGYSRLPWFMAGALLPILGVVMAFNLKPRRSAAGRRDGTGRKIKRPPKRCCGSYIPDCEGCPYFKRSLFGEPAKEEKKGMCLLYGRNLKIEPVERSSRVVLEDEDEEMENEDGN